MGYKNFQEMHERLAALIGDVSPDSPQGKKRRRILAAATELFVTQGYRKTNIEEIARSAGIAKGTVYLYFATKADVLMAAIGLEKQRGLVLVDGVFDATASARERLRRFLRAGLLMIADSPLLTRVTREEHEFIAALSDVDAELTASALAERQEFVAGLLDEAALPGRWDPVERAARVKVLGALMYLGPEIRSDALRQGLSIEDFVDALTATVVDGLRPSSQSGSTS